MVSEGWVTVLPEIRDAIRVVTSVGKPLTSFSQITEFAEGLELMMEHTRVTVPPVMPEYPDDPTWTVGKARHRDKGYSEKQFKIFGRFQHLCCQNLWIKICITGSHITLVSHINPCLFNISNKWLGSLGTVPFEGDLITLPFIFNK